MIIHGRIKTIRTRTKADPEGNVIRTTSITMEFQDLDPVREERMAEMEYRQERASLDITRPEHKVRPADDGTSSTPVSSFTVGANSGREVLPVADA